MSVERLDLTAQGQVRYQQKTPYRDGTTHIVLTPVDFIARLAALPKRPEPAQRCACGGNFDRARVTRLCHRGRQAVRTFLEMRPATRYFVPLNAHHASGAPVAVPAMRSKLAVPPAGVSSRVARPDAV